MKKIIHKIFKYFGFVPISSITSLDPNFIPPNVQNLDYDIITFREQYDMSEYYPNGNHNLLPQNIKNDFKKRFLDQIDFSEFIVSRSDGFQFVLFTLRILKKK